ncbi:trehalose-phosphatase [Pseudoxanthomonas wuyuanensis]|uniref:Trehalose 6-phosphate phosphatase n=1 Tax=Pseudoxanthomonas wuyuanensis TaxID=1073196 RepID=A0A286DB44_9GAMM|nr:trehalose-phosphatase [Pseudoxanthomonas wuyuanensis]KAF1721792.1 trehalose-phosphatase [Pseudoxanthomonas wuyuanensis]SOD55867.1 trehalose 6-phosphatase [Pseudoxanthomonas wuyuanensis]
MAAGTPLYRPPPPLLDDACALFLDVDGTLLEFASQPDRVRLPPQALAVIETLSDRLQGALALVSGRPLHELDRLFWPLQLPAAGLHGHQFRGSETSPGSTVPEALSHFKREALALARRHQGVMVEDKGSHLALHWRGAPHAAEQVRALAAARIGDIAGYRLQPGDHVVELVPADVDKGGAVRTLMRERPFLGRTPVFVGDDLTDEYGFAAVNANGGWSVLVGRRDDSHANYGLADPGAVHAWLRANAENPASAFSPPTEQT